MRVTPSMKPRFGSTRSKWKPGICPAGCWPWFWSGRRSIGRNCGRIGTESIPANPSVPSRRWTDSSLTKLRWFKAAWPKSRASIPVPFLEQVRHGIAESRQQVFALQFAARPDQPALVVGTQISTDSFSGSMIQTSCAPLPKKSRNRSSISARVLFGEGTSTARSGAPGKKRFDEGRKPRLSRFFITGAPPTLTPCASVQALTSFA